MVEIGNIWVSPPDKVTLDSETCGLAGMIVLLQYRFNQTGPINLYHVWKEPVHKTLALIESFLKCAVVGFNLGFDWFMLAKLYTIWKLLPPDWIPEQHINEIAMLEPKGQDGPCIKPVAALDLLLHSRRGPCQSLLARDDIRIRRVPTALAYVLVDELDRRVRLPNIYYAKSADPGKRWHVYDIKRPDGTIDEHFKDVVMKFYPAGGLKYLAQHLGGFEPKHFEEIEPNTKPIELGYAPTALAISTPEEGWAVYHENQRPGKPRKVKGYAWPGIIQEHIDHWYTSGPAQEYANDDIVYTEWLDGYFNFPEPGDDDSTLACMVAVVRWRGFPIDKEATAALLEKKRAVVATSPININKHADVRAYLMECMDEIECHIIKESTKKAKVESVAAWEIDAALDVDEEDDDTDENVATAAGFEFLEGEPCLKCKETGQFEGKTCCRCNGLGHNEKGQHPAAIRAEFLLKIKSAAKEVEILEKLLKAGKFHMDFNVLGTKSARMSGAGGLNAQGIKRTEEVRLLFPFAREGEEMSIGDFESFEVCILDAVANEPKLHEILTSGRKIHAIFGELLFAPMTYEDVLATKGQEKDYYTISKNSLFGGVCYGGNAHTLERKYNIRKERAQSSLDEFYRMLPGVKQWRDGFEKRFCTMKQEDQASHGKIEWQEPAQHAESLLGDKRDYALENEVCRALYDLAQRPPKHWKEVKVRVVRRDRVQKASGAVQSALFGAAFALQGANCRSAANHQIQATGARVCKSVQRKLWDLQPWGVNEWHIATANVHDEIITTHKPELREKVTETVHAAVETFRPVVPLIEIDWKSNVANWAEK